MAFISAFKGLRFKEQAGDIKELVCPPYDIISAQQKADFIAKNPNNVIRLELPEGDDPYLSAANTLNEWLSKGIVGCDEKDTVYVYEEEFEYEGQKKKITGIVCRVKVHEFSEGIILPHENTLSKAKEDRFNLMKATGCNFSQIYSLYNDDGSTQKTLDEITSSKPVCEFPDMEGVIQRLWCVTDEETIKALVSQFNDRKLFIADGHHRYETALRYKKHIKEQGGTSDNAEDYCMMMLVAMESDGLVVFPTHRIIKNLASFNCEEFLNKAEELFDIARIAECDIDTLMKGGYDANKKCFTLCHKGDYYLLTLREEERAAELLGNELNSVKTLDVTVLHSLLLERILGIDKENMANGKNLVYTKVKDEAIEAALSDADCSFIINPTRVSEIRDVAAEGGKMPQKSTYFWPKLITGLVMNKIK